MLPPPEVTVCQPIQKEVVDYFELNGTTQALETVDIRARIKGFLDQILFVPRAKVNKGQLLFVIDPRQYQAASPRCRALWRPKGEPGIRGIRL